METSWRQKCFKSLGIVVFGGGVYAFYDFGRELAPLFARYVEGVWDSFEAFTILSSFFLGTVALCYVGVRLLALRSFSSDWHYFAILPLVAWTLGVFNVGPIYDMDLILSQSVSYIGVYVVFLGLIFFAHIVWFIPVSHEKMGHVGTLVLKKPNTTLRTVLTIVLLWALLVFHPAEIETTIEMLFSPIFSYI